jgi:hypothetical protein
MLLSRLVIKFFLRIQGKVEADMVKVTIGHRIKGEKSKYISAKQEQVKVCAEIIYQEYFG